MYCMAELNHKSGQSNSMYIIIELVFGEQCMEHWVRGASPASYCLQVQHDYHVKVLHLSAKD